MMRNYFDFQLKKKMHDQIPLDCVDVPLAFLNVACLHIFDHPDIADASVEATNFAFHWNFWKWCIEIPRPVRDRTIQRTNKCWQRVFGITSLRNMLMADRIDSHDTVWLSQKHANALRQLLLNADGPHESFETLIHELQF